MHICRNLFLLVQLFVLTICQEQLPENGLNLYLKSRMKEFPEWLQATGGGPQLAEQGPIQISEKNGFIELNGQIRDLQLTGHTEHYVTTSADFFNRQAQVTLQFFRNLEITGNYSLRGRVSYKPISGQGVFRMRNYRYQDYSQITVHVSSFGITADGRMDLTNSNPHSYGQWFDYSLPEFEGLQSAGYEKYIQKSIKQYMVQPFKEYLSDRLKDYFRGVLEAAYLPTILHDNYDGNLYSSFSVSPWSFNEEDEAVLTEEP